MLYNANKTLRVEEEFDQYGFLKLGMIKNWEPVQRGVYWRHGSNVGGAPCTTLTSYDAFDSKPGCGTYANDLTHQITR